MSVAYKLTDRDGYTRRGLEGETLWTVGSVVAPTGRTHYGCHGDDSVPIPCGPGVLHAYIAPEVAVLGDPVHGRYGTTARLFRIETVDGGKWCNDGLKRWTDSSVRVLEELPLPTLTLEERIAWAICMDPRGETREWAVKWLSGVDRTAESADKALRAHKYASRSYAIFAAKFAAIAVDTGSPLFAGDAEEYAASTATFEPTLMAAFNLARAILAGEIPAEEYDQW